MHTKVIISILALLCSAATMGRALQRPTLRYEHFGREKGLTSDIITELYQDRSGYLWVGSRDGLRVYDGYSFQLFNHDTSNPHSLSDNAIRVVYEDRKRRLWVGTNAGGLELLDRTTGQFRHFRHDPANASSLSHDSVYAIVEDKDGSLWVGTQSGLNHLDTSTFQFERVSADPKTPGALPNEYVAALHIDRKGSLWVGTVGGGICRRDPKTGNFNTLAHDPHKKTSISSDRVFAITEDANGKLWIGTDKGVNRLDPATGEAHQFLSSEKGRPDNLTITSLAWGRSGTLLAGTLDGLNEIDTTGKVTRFEAKQKSSAHDLKIITLLADSEGNVWIGTWGNGLVRASQENTSFSVINASPTGLSDEDVTHALIDHSGRLWVGTVGGGLNRRDPGMATFYHYPVTVYGSAILAIYEDADGSIWAGTYEGLEHIIPETGRITKFANVPSNSDSLGRGYVTDVLRDGDGQLWVATGGSGVNRIRADGKSFDHFVQSSANPQSLSDDFVTVLHQSKSSRLWVGTRSGGLNDCNRRTMQCRRYVPGHEHSIGHHYVTSIYEDAGGRIWAGTAGGGLNLIEEPQNPNPHLTQFTEKNGLPDNNTMSIAEDQGRLWLGTKHGLVLFDPVTHDVLTFGFEEGLPSEEFNGSATARDDRFIYMGTPAGLLLIQRGAMWQSAKPSPTVITSLEALRGSSQSNLSVLGAQRIDVPYGTMISFEAAVLDFAEPIDHRYQYQLSGVDDAWIPLAWRRGTTFSRLSPGMYTLRVSGRNNRGVWSEASPIRFQVVPPVWMQRWFRAAIVLLLGALIIGTHRYRTAALKKHNRELLALQSQRERALQEVRKSEEELQAAYSRLQTLTRRIDAVAEEERKRIAHELHDELGQALTAAKINLQLLPSPTDPDTRMKRISDTVDLVDNMISRVRALSLDLRPPLLYELGLMPALRAYAESQARRAGLEISIDLQQLEHRLPGETEIAAFRVMQEAMTNVIRHAQATRVELSVGMHGGLLQLEIRDNGVGFDLSTMQSRAESGHAHFGLAGMRERAELLGGNTVVRSNPSGGTTVRMEIPAAFRGEAVCG